jgi:hypothetical protein
MRADQIAAEPEPPRVFRTDEHACYAEFRFPSGEAIR